MRCRILQCLIWVYTVCSGLSVRILTVNMVYPFYYLFSLFFCFFFVSKQIDEWHTVLTLIRCNFLQYDLWVYTVCSDLKSEFKTTLWHIQNILVEWQAEQGLIKRDLHHSHKPGYLNILGNMVCLFIWVEVLQPSQPIRLMSSRSVYLTTLFPMQA